MISETATYTADATATTILTGSNNFGSDGTKYRGTTTAGTLTETTFNIKAPERITTLFGFDIDALVGTRVEGRNLARVLRWDTASESWSAEDVVEENGVNAFIRDDNYVYAQTGEFGKLFFYNGEKLEPFTASPASGRRPSGQSSIRARSRTDMGCRCSASPASRATRPCRASTPSAPTARTIRRCSTSPSPSPPARSRA